MTAGLLRCPEAAEPDGAAQGERNDPQPAAPASTTCDNESCNPSRMVAKRRTRRMAKTTPGLKEAGVPTVLWNAKPRTIAMMSGLSAAVE